MRRRSRRLHSALVWCSATLDRSLERLEIADRGLDANNVSGLHREFGDPAVRAGGASLENGRGRPPRPGALDPKVGHPLPPQLRRGPVHERDTTETRDTGAAGPVEVQRLERRVMQRKSGEIGNAFHGSFNDVYCGLTL